MNNKNTKHKKSHEITRSYIEQWTDPCVKGFWLFDIERQNLRFCSGKDRASFAKENYLFIPKVNGKRIQAVEKWLSKSESSFASLLAGLKDRIFKNHITIEEIIDIQRTAISFHFRSAYQIKKIAQQIESDPKLKCYFCITNENDAHLCAVENLINIISIKIKDCTPCRLDIFYGFNDNLLSCDRPSIFDEPNNMWILPIGFDAIMTIKKDDEYILQNNPCEDRDWSSWAVEINNLIIDSARKWVVSKTDDVLAIYKDQLKSSEVQRRVNSEVMQFIPPEVHNALDWWRIDPSREK